MVITAAHVYYRTNALSAYTGEFWKEGGRKSESKGGEGEQELEGKKGRRQM